MKAEDFFKIISESKRAESFTWKPLRNDTLKHFVEIVLDGDVCIICVQKQNDEYIVSDLFADQFLKMHNIQH